MNKPVSLSSLLAMIWKKDETILMLGMFLEMNAKEMMNAGRVMTKVKCSAAKSSNMPGSNGEKAK